MPANHPAFPNPAIVEALSEIHLTPAVDRDWSPTRPLGLYSLIESDYPKMELFPEASLRVEMGGTDGRRQVVHEERQRIRFTSEDGTRMLQVSHAGDVLVHNFLKPYPGWEQMKSSILKAWQLASTILKPLAVRRIGLRYINRIPHEETATVLGDWLKATQRIPPDMIHARAPYVLTLNVTLNEAHRLAETVKSYEPNNNEPFGGTIFDLDRIWEGEASTKDIEQIVDSLHDDIWNEFSAAMTPRLLARLNQSPVEIRHATSIS